LQKESGAQSLAPRFVLFLDNFGEQVSVENKGAAESRRARKNTFMN
jgi:hypothetical protein